MKRLFLMLLVFVLAFSFVACEENKEKEQVSDTPTLTVEITAELTASSTVEPTTESTAATPEVTPTITPIPDKSYVVKVERADFPIYEGPGYSYSFVRTVDVATAYTIVEEVRDKDGNLWGKLKSGAGWIDLTLLEKEKNNKPIVSVEEFKNMPVDYYQCASDVSEYAIKMILHVKETVTNVSIFSVDYTEGFKKDKDLCTIEKWEPTKPIVAELSFPGDMTTYGICVTDKNGKTHTYGLGQSGMDGSLEIWEVK